jgi:2-dehydropantoate 2-reductase
VRLVVFGAGAIGGVVGARLHQAGHDVRLIARGAHGQAIRRHGLRLEEPGGSSVLAIPALAEPRELVWSGQEVVLLCVKSQDTPAALAALRAVAPARQAAVVCAQNGVENERVALRMFAHVYGAVVMLPAAHLEPGTVEAYGAALTGIIDVGRYPEGADERCEELARALAGAGIESASRPDVMRGKYAKLVMNLGNAADALCAPGEARNDVVDAARQEGRQALRAAGIAFDDDQVSDVRARWARFGVQDIDGRRRAGSSTWQSLARGSGTVETDFLNGEAVLIGRLHGVPTPVNEALCLLAERHVRERRPPGTLAAGEVLDLARERVDGWTR